MPDFQKVAPQQARPSLDESSGRPARAPSETVPLAPSLRTGKGAEQKDVAQAVGHWAEAGPDTLGTFLPNDVRGKMEGAYGQSFGDVRVHPNSSRAGGAVQALAEGSNLHFAPGRFQPNEPEGQWLLAHELAHVVQQRGGSGLAEVPQAFSPDTQRDLHEHEADTAADRAMAGQRAQVRLGAPNQPAQHYEAWEHRQLGNRGGGGRSVTTKHGVVLSYGELMALAGDFYSSPETVMNAPAGELEVILRAMREEAAEAEVSPEHRPTEKQMSHTTAEFQGATAWRERPHYDGQGNPTGKKQGEVAGTDKDSFFGLAGNNASHYSPDNLEKNWRPHHQSALNLAKQYHDEHKRAGGPPRPAPAHKGSQRSHAEAPTQAPELPVGPEPADDKLNQALLSDGFACHFLTDAFSSGHLVSGNVGREVGGAFWKAHEADIKAALWGAAKSDKTYLPPQVVENAEFQKKVDSVCLKLVHDYLNGRPVTVMNKRGEKWQTQGDAHLGQAPETQRLASEATRMSRQSVEETAQSGTSKAPFAAAELAPSQVQLGDTLMPLAQFAESPEIFMGLLRPLLLNPRASNPLYQLIKNNIGLLADDAKEKAVRAEQATVAAGQRGVHHAEEAGHEVKERAIDTGHAVKQGAIDTGHAVKQGVIDTGHAVKEGAIRTGHAVKYRTVEAGHALKEQAIETGHAVKEGATRTGRAIKNEAVEAGHAVHDWGARQVHKVEEAGHEVKEGARAVGHRVKDGVVSTGRAIGSWGAERVHEAGEVAHELHEDVSAAGGEVRDWTEHQVQNAKALGQRVKGGAVEAGHSVLEAGQEQIDKTKNWFDGWL